MKTVEIKCGHCEGTGKVNYQDKKFECPVCQGDGKSGFSEIEDNPETEIKIKENKQ